MDFKKEIAYAQKQLLELEQQRHEIERQMQGWARIIEGYQTLGEKFTVRLGGPPTREEVQAEQETPSLPAKVLSCLFTVGQPIGATQIRDWLLATGAAHTEMKNLLINIHTTLRRLVPEQVEEIVLNDGSKLYKYITPIQRAINQTLSSGRWDRPEAKPLTSGLRHPGTTMDMTKKK